MPLPASSSDLPGSGRRSLVGNDASGRATLDPLPYSVLLRMGFAVPRTVAGRAVRSYRTLSPLPRTLARPRRSALCCTFRRVAAPRRWRACCPWELGLSSRRPSRRANTRSPPTPGHPTANRSSRQRRKMRPKMPFPPSELPPSRRSSAAAASGFSGAIRSTVWYWTLARTGSSRRS